MTAVRREEGESEVHERLVVTYSRRCEQERSAYSVHYLAPPRRRTASTLFWNPTIGDVMRGAQH